MGFDKTASAGFLANHMARLFAAGLQRRVAPLGLAPAQFMVLLELWQDDGLTQRDLVERLDVEQATMANTLARMVRDGLVTRMPHLADRRAQIVRLTPHARALALFFLSSHAGEAGHNCPVACTAGIVKALAAEGSKACRGRVEVRPFQTEESFRALLDS